MSIGSSPHDANNWQDVGEIPAHGYLAPAALEFLRDLKPQRLLDLGCGDGRLSVQMRQIVPRVTGMDFSVTGIQVARDTYPDVEFVAHGLDDPLSEEQCGAYDAVTAIEVIEHLLLPRSLFARAQEALVPGGRMLVTTPFHGYWKNLALSLAGKWDHHHMAMHDYGHIKFFSPETLAQMAREQGFALVELKRVGRIPPIAASMVAVFERSS